MLRTSHCHDERPRHYPAGRSSCDKSSALVAERTQPTCVESETSMRSTSLGFNEQHIATSSCPTVNDVTHYDEQREGNKLEMRINFLKPGCLFVNKYVMEAKKIPGKPHCRYAMEQSTGREVFLKFFPGRPQAFKNAIIAHRFLQRAQPHICTMIDSIENLDGFPPVIILERGCLTLADVMMGHQMSSIEQRAVLYSVMESLKCMHDHGFVHGNLNPSHIMWFTGDFAWKLIGLSAATTIGEDCSIQPNVSRFGSPEMTHALNQGLNPIYLWPSLDMWSFGVIAFEILTRSFVTDVNGVQKLLDRLVSDAQVSVENATQQWLSADRNGQGATLNQQILQFIQTLMHKDPAKRRSVTASLENALLCTTVNESLHQFTLRHFCPGIETPLQKWSLLSLIHQKLTSVIDIELFAEDSDPSLPFHKRRSKDPPAFFDDYLEHDAVYVLKLGESFRLCLDLTWDPQMQLPIEKIVSVVAKMPDAEEKSLDVVQAIETGSVKAMISLDPKRILSQRLNSISPVFGRTDTKYVKIDIRAKVQLGDCFLQEMDLYHHVYCKVVHANNRLRLYKWLGMLVTKEERRLKQQPQ